MDTRKKIFAAGVVLLVALIVGIGLFSRKGGQIKQGQDTARVDQPQSSDSGQDESARDQAADGADGTQVAKGGSPEDTEGREFDPAEARMTGSESESSESGSAVAVGVVPPTEQGAAPSGKTPADQAKLAADGAQKSTGFFQSVMSVFRGWGSKKGDTEKATSTGESSTPGAELGSLAPGMPEGRSAKDIDAPLPPVAPCVSVNFSTQTKKLSDEDFTRHRHVLKLARSDINQKSICVRVNGRPVKHEHYKNKKDQLLIGPVASSKAKIQVRYCVGKNSCNEDCSIPRDDFMDAIGASDDDSLPTAKWHAGEEASDGLAVVDDEIKRELAAAEDMSIFQDWSGDQEVPSCGAKRAANAPASSPES